jgi:hypothetical protein
MSYTRKIAAADLDGREEKPMAELRMHTIRDQYNPVQKSEPVDLTGTSLRHQNSKSELDRRLDQALAATFPASDSIAIIIC